MKIKGFLFAIIGCLCFLNNAYAEDNNTEINLKFGGWSHHKSEDKYKDSLPLTQNHKGLGIEYYKAVDDTHLKHWYGVGLWYMKDSFGADSIQVSAAYKYRINLDIPVINSIDLNINAGFVNRYYRTFYKNSSHEYFYYTDERKTIPTFSPFITINTPIGLQADFTYVPKFLADSFTAGYELYFMRLGYTF